jgi:hypothetical protein
VANCAAAEDFCALDADVAAAAEDEFSEQANAAVSTITQGNRVILTPVLLMFQASGDPEVPASWDSIESGGFCNFICFLIEVDAGGKLKRGGGRTHLLRVQSICSFAALGQQRARTILMR